MIFVVSTASCIVAFGALFVATAEVVDAKQREDRQGWRDLVWFERRHEPSAP
jgi:hypothetical protein